MIAYLAVAMHRWDVPYEAQTLHQIAKRVSNIVAHYHGPVIEITDADLAAVGTIEPARVLTAWMDLMSELGIDPAFSELDSEESGLIDEMVMCAILELPGAERWFA